MSKLIYDIRENKYLQKIIDERTKYFDSPFYQDCFGRYGTNEWWCNIETAGLIKNIQGIITKLLPSGKTSIPQFEINIDGEIQRFNAEGDEELYPVGANVKLFVVKKDEVFIDKLGGDLLIRVELLRGVIERPRPFKP